MHRLPRQRFSTACYATGDQLQSQGNTTYSYDANGRLASKLTSVEGEQQLTTYVYSSLGQLLQVDTPEQSIEYRHNALGQRVAKLVNGQVTEKYLWRDLTTLLATYDGQGNVKQRFEHTLGHTPTSFTQNGERYFIQSDHLGSPRVITDSSGSIVKTINYDSYGNVIEDANPGFEIPFGFAGGLYDKDTGLIRFGFRDYDPSTGRWTARDPIGFGGGDTNLYGYVLGDPINFIDNGGLHFSSFQSALNNASSLASALAGQERSPQASIVYTQDRLLPHRGGNYERTSPSHMTVGGNYYYTNANMIAQPVSNLKDGNKSILAGVLAFPRHSVTADEARQQAQIMADEIGADVYWYIRGGEQGVVSPGMCPIG